MALNFHWFLMPVGAYSYFFLGHFSLQCVNNSHNGEFRLFAYCLLRVYSGPRPFLITFLIMNPLWLYWLSVRMHKHRTTNLFELAVMRVAEKFTNRGQMFLICTILRTENTEQNRYMYFATLLIYIEFFSWTISVL